MSGERGGIGEELQLGELACLGLLRRGDGWRAEAELQPGLGLMVVIAAAAASGVSLLLLLFLLVGGVGGLLRH